ncbi:1-acyl-sn-glycerol-3-phosphate acyltransferase [Ruficoccus amylovorans]|uniref:1-acyl-sn-glycerol-3-phosphate acyltransferase n=1 Tax=Ruficoccus amylovorans TaxID=1804625 RepID=A0A842HDT5_9BACT|nr:lysophospholipid acyltransferase family protein [Ruficoccus amylovorans]MBC2594380.1 1-acyl-sn-glycerol-3-phosphate acyltransferase [Ruficoccus amylovorans]
MSATPSYKPSRSLGLYLRYLAMIVLFGLWAFALNVLCALLLPLGLERRSPGSIRRILADSMRRYTRLLAMMGMGRVRFTGLDKIPAGPCLLVANHTGLLDALFLMIERPQMVCVFKSSLRRNPFFRYMIRQGGFIANRDGMESLRAMEKALGEGRQVLVFPEGTRTAVPPLNRFKAGFGWVAKETGVPVCALLIRNPSGLLCKGGGLFGRYAFPFTCEFRYLGEFRPAPDEPPPLFARRMEDFYREQLAKEDFSLWPK